MFGNLFNKQKKEEAVTLNEELVEAPVTEVKVNCEAAELLAIIADPSIKGEFTNDLYGGNKCKEDAVIRLINPLILRNGTEWLEHEFNISVKHEFIPNPWNDPPEPWEIISISNGEDWRGVSDLDFDIGKQEGPRYDDLMRILNDPNVIKMDQEYRKHKVADSNEYKFRLLSEKLSKIVK